MAVALAPEGAHAATAAAAAAADSGDSVQLEEVIVSARKRDERLGYSFIEDAAQFEGEPEFPQPALILHGSRDEIVPVEVDTTTLQNGKRPGSARPFDTKGNRSE